MISDPLLVYITVLYTIYVVLSYDRKKAHLIANT